MQCHEADKYFMMAIIEQIVAVARRKTGVN